MHETLHRLDREMNGEKTAHGAVKSNLFVHFSVSTEHGPYQRGAILEGRLPPSTEEELVELQGEIAHLQGDGPGARAAIDVLNYFPV